MAPIGRRLQAAFIAALLLAGVLVVVAAPRSNAAPDTFVELPDGVKIAIGIQWPEHYDPAATYPTVFEFSGYDGASAQGGTLAKDLNVPGELSAVPRDDSRQITKRWEDKYVTVHASVRGTGCSGGEFDIFSQQSAEDGKYIIDHWIANQTWSNGDVAIVGHSYSGLMGFLVAATQPEHLRAISVSGLIDDLYRGLAYPGGVSNDGFPVLWTAGIRTFYDVGGGVLPGIVRPSDSDDSPTRQQDCAQAQTTKSRTIFDDPAVQGTQGVDNEWFRSRSLITYARDINVPIHITGAYQDEQTGPRGPTHLWEAIREDGLHPPIKRLLLLNGNHDAQNPGTDGPEVWQDRKAFIDHFLLHAGPAPAPKSVRVLWEYHVDDETGQLVSNGHTDATDWPLPDTVFTNWYLQPGGGLTTSPAATDAEFRYVTGSPRQSWSYQAGPTTGSPFTTSDGQDQTLFASRPFATPMAIHGPIMANLDIATTAPDTDLFVELADDAPDGSRTFLQRGLLKAAHRAIDPTKSDYWQPNPRMPKILYRPWRPHTTNQLVTPGDIITYNIEIFPVGHIFRAHHRLVIIVHAPPLTDSYYAYAPQRAPAGINTIYVGPHHLSSIMLPVVPMPQLGPFEPQCGQLDSVRCVPAS